MRFSSDEPLSLSVSNPRQRKCVDVHTPLMILAAPTGNARETDGVLLRHKLPNCI
jgi:hypothetical protein